MQQRNISPATFSKSSLRFLPSIPPAMAILKVWISLLYFAAVAWSAHNKDITRIQQRPETTLLCTGESEWIRRNIIITKLHNTGGGGAMTDQRHTWDYELRVRNGVITIWRNNRRSDNQNIDVDEHDTSKNTFEETTTTTKGSSRETNSDWKNFSKTHLKAKQIRRHEFRRVDDEHNPNQILQGRKWTKIHTRHMNWKT